MLAPTLEKKIQKLQNITHPFLLPRFQYEKKHSVSYPRNFKLRADTKTCLYKKEEHVKLKIHDKNGEDPAKPALS